MNQREEQRVVEALRALTGGLTVTEQDILIAGGRVRSGLEPPPPRRRAALLVAAAVAAVVAGVVAVQVVDGREDSAPPATPPTPTPAETLRDALQADAFRLRNAAFLDGTQPTSASLAGVWVERPGDGEAAVSNSFPLLVDGDGTWLVGAPRGGLWWGTSSLVGDTWTRRVDHRSHCAVNAGLGDLVLTAKAALARDGSLRVQLTESPAQCTPIDDREVWDSLAPGSAVADYLLAATDEVVWEAPSNSDLGGLYVAPETGAVLDIDKSGTYRFYESFAGPRFTPADAGVLDIDASDGGFTGSCEGGRFGGRFETGRTPGVAGYVAPHNTLRFTLTEKGCPSGLDEQSVWVNVYFPRSGTPLQE